MLKLWIESFTIFDSEPWIETFPIPSEGTSVIVYYDYKNPYLEKQVKKQQMMFQAGRKEIVHILMSVERILLKDRLMKNMDLEIIKTGPGSEYNKIKKWGDRGFE